MYFTGIVGDAALVFVDGAGTFHRYLKTRNSTAASTTSNSVIAKVASNICASVSSIR